MLSFVLCVSLYLLGDVCFKFFACVRRFSATRPRRRSGRARHNIGAGGAAMEYRRRPHQGRADHEEAAEISSPERHECREPKAPDGHSPRPPPAGGLEDQADQSSEKAVEHQADSTEDYRDVPNAADRAA